uniref:DUF7674 family protein n=1 Tax=Paenibacillus kobensis TaxID=59841 RepID=UPI000FD87AAD|nr:hypothetical protein [Paenibacillus kobensis]
MFFGDINDYLIELLRKDIETELLRRLFDFYERMDLTGDALVKEVLSCTILERLGDEKEVLQIAYRYKGKETRKVPPNGFAAAVRSVPMQAQRKKRPSLEYKGRPRSYRLLLIGKTYW